MLYISSTAWYTSKSHFDMEGQSVHKTDPWEKSGLSSRNPSLAKMAVKPLAISAIENRTSQILVWVSARGVFMLSSWQILSFKFSSFAIETYPNAFHN